MQKIQLSIPELCHQNWNEMSPTEQGRFCNACAKEVIDFTTMSDTALLNYFSGLKNEKLCGRAYPDQLERTITLPKYPKKKIFWYWNYITMLFLFFSKTNTAKAQGGIKLATELTPNTIKPVIKTETLQGRVGGIAINNNVIKGKITDDSGIAVAGATIIIKGTKKATTTDIEGFYKINTTAKSNTLQVSAVGFETKEIQINISTNADIILTKIERMFLGEVTIVSRKINVIENDSPVENIKHIVVFEVKDNATMQPINKAVVVINSNGYYKPDSNVTDKKGIYKLKKLLQDETVTVKIIADGYKQEVIEIKGDDFEQRKITQRIFLEKLPTVADYKNMDSVKVISYGYVKHSCSIGGAVCVVKEQKRNVFTDSLKIFTTKITGALKVSPNPVKKGNAFTIAIKLKQIGTYHIKITTAAGQIVLQKQSNTTVKQYIDEEQTNSSWSSGVYYISLFDSNNKIVSTTKFLIF